MSGKIQKKMRKLMKQEMRAPIDIEKAKSLVNSAVASLNTAIKDKVEKEPEISRDDLISWIGTLMFDELKDY